MDYTTKNGIKKAIHHTFSLPLEAPQDVEKVLLAPLTLSAEGAWVRDSALGGDVLEVVVLLSIVTCERKEAVFRTIGVLVLGGAMIGVGVSGAGV